MYLPPTQTVSPPPSSSFLLLLHPLLSFSPIPQIFLDLGMLTTNSALPGLTPPPPAASSVRTLLFTSWASTRQFGRVGTTSNYTPHRISIMSLTLSLPQA